MPTDGAIAKFLYTILKQLDLKSIDWQEVANGLDITNGHAARMRFSRFKQQMEGTTSHPRKPTPATPRLKKTRPEKPPSSERPNDNANRQQAFGTRVEPIVQGQPIAKAEEITEGGLGFKREPGLGDEAMRDIGPLVKPEPIIKEDMQEDEILWAGAEVTMNRAAPEACPGISTYTQQALEGHFAAQKVVTLQLSPEPIVAKENNNDPKEYIVKIEPA
ncbi:hypothetical protein N7G274_005557 [Stereocaulon virgatum]|uniref:Myb-like DNA-binding domain-containing protein n=1 Tax=Stereocaulon virgatum TaxID=373712 RepID=A0ABR4A7V9_9LECA